jgi:orotate phosphoribosyltransferase
MSSLLKVPSGREFGRLDMDIMTASADVGFVKWYDEPRTLASGRKSHIYVEGRQDLTENPHVLRLMSRRILIDTKRIMDDTNDMRRPRFIGIPHVAHGWTPSIAMVDEYEDITERHACFAILRSEPKGHGGRKGEWIAWNNQPDKFLNILFDNTVTDSGSKKTAGAHLLVEGCPPEEVGAMVFVDRQQGGLNEMVGMHFLFVYANYFLLDIAYAFQHIGKWPTDAAEQVDKEIKENQIGP